MLVRPAHLWYPWRPKDSDAPELRLQLPCEPTPPPPPPVLGAEVPLQGHPVFMIIESLCHFQILELPATMPMLKIPYSRALFHTYNF